MSFQDCNPNFGTEVFSIVDPLGGGDYSTLNTWESSEQRNLVTADEIEVALCRSGGNLLSAQLTIAGWTTDPHNYPEIRGDNNHSHEGVFTTNKAYCETTGGGGGSSYVIRLEEADNIRISRMQVRLQTGGIGNTHHAIEGNLPATLGLGNGAQIMVDRSIVINKVDGSLAACIFIRGGGIDTADGLGGREHMVTSCLIMSLKATASRNRGIRTERQGSASIALPRMRAYNNTIVASGGTGIHTENAGGDFDRIISQNNLIIADTPYDDASFNFDGSSGIFGKHNDAITASADGAANPSGHNPALIGINIFDHIVNPILDEENGDWHLKKDSPLASSGYDLRAEHFAPNVGEGPYDGRCERHINLDIDSQPIVAGSGGTFTAGSGGIFPVGADLPLDTALETIGGYVEAEPGFASSGFLGGWVIAEPTFDSLNNLLGGFVQGEGLPGQEAVALLGGWASGFAFIQPEKTVGGYVNALPLTDASGFVIGGAVSGLFSHGPDFLGGFVWGVPGLRQFAEMHARTLVKANSEDAFQQGLNLDAVIAFIQRDQEEFNGLFRVANTFQSDFNARLVVGQNKRPPRVVITSVTPQSGLPGSGGLEVCIVASGNLFDGEQWVINQIDFGEPVRDSASTPNNSISGFDQGNQNPGIWSGCYNYRDPGVYIVTARGVDNLGMVGMDHFVLNLTSGLTACVDYPCISISGIPRIGDVPPQLKVDFDVVASGSFTPSSPTDPNLFWNFGNLARSNKVSPFTYYASPGLYTPVARFRIQVGGQWRWAADTLRVGFNF